MYIHNAGKFRLKGNNIYFMLFGLIPVYLGYISGAKYSDRELINGAISKEFYDIVSKFK